MGNSASRRNKKLEKSIQSRKPKRVKYWLNKGADPNAYSKKSNYSFLSMAITLREEALVKLLLDHGADPNQKSWQPSSKSILQRRQNNDDEYPIHIAAAHGGKGIMETLIKSNTDIDMGHDQKLGTALHQAARFGHSQLAELLLVSGADIIAIDSRLNIPLHIAATYGQTKVAEILLAHGSPVDTVNMKHWTPLHYASSEGASRMVKLLLSHDANPYAADTMQKTPVDLSKSDEILRMFLECSIANEVFAQGNSQENLDVNGEKDNTHTMSTPNSPQGVIVPPKPARKFTFDSQTLGRIDRKDSTGRQETKAQDVPKSPDTKSRLKRSNTYSNFGHRNRKSEIFCRKSQNKTEQTSKSSFIKKNQDAYCKINRVKSLPPSRNGKHKKAENIRSKRSHRSMSSPHNQTSNTVTQKHIPEENPSSPKYNNHMKIRRTKSAGSPSKMASKNREKRSEEAMIRIPEEEPISKNKDTEVISNHVGKEINDISSQEQGDRTSQNGDVFRLKSSLAQSLNDLSATNDLAKQSRGEIDNNHNFSSKRNAKHRKSDRIHYRAKKRSQRVYLEKTQSHAF